MCQVRVTEFESRRTLENEESWKSTRFFGELFCVSSCLALMPGACLAKSAGGKCTFHGKCKPSEQQNCEKDQNS